MEVNFFMGFGPGSGLFIRPAKPDLFAREGLRHRFARIVGPIERLSSTGEPELGAVRIDVWRDVAGKEVHHTACGICQMREATGLSMSIGALMLA